MKNFIKNFTISRYWIVTILFVAAKVFIHFLTNTRYELLRDEMLFFNMGEHLSAGCVFPGEGTESFPLQGATIRC